MGYVSDKVSTAALRWCAVFRAVKVGLGHEQQHQLTMLGSGAGQRAQRAMGSLGHDVNRRARMVLGCEDRRCTDRTVNSQYHSRRLLPSCQWRPPFLDEAVVAGMRDEQDERKKKFRCGQDAGRQSARPGRCDGHQPRRGWARKAGEDARWAMQAARDRLQVSA